MWAAGGWCGRSLAVLTALVAARRDIAYEVRALGSLEPKELVQITAEVAGAAMKARFNAGDRVALVGGMAVSTLLTLFVVPAGYSVLDDALAWGRARRGKGRAPAAEEGTRPDAKAEPVGPA